jgi:enterochelin esterase-like enzyme
MSAERQLTACVGFTPASHAVASLKAMFGIAALAAAVVAFGAPVSSPGLPSTWARVASGPGGGVVLQGWIPNTYASWDHRASAVYLPPGYDPSHRYPVIYLLHGMAGSPSSFWDALRLTTVADGVIAAHPAQSFIAVMPVAGPTVNPSTGEWAGVWENYVVGDVVPWIDGHLPTQADPAGRALEGLCAGGYGAVDIGLRHPGLFGTLGSWEGYFAPVFRDGPFVHATPAQLAAHDPSLLLQHQASLVARSGVRFYVSAGGNHGIIRESWSVSFVRQLQALHLPYQLRLLPHRHFWRATLPSALAYAAAAFR